MACRQPPLRKNFARLLQTSGPRSPIVPTPPWLSLYELGPGFGWKILLLGEELGGGTLWIASQPEEPCEAPPSALAAFSYRLGTTLAELARAWTRVR